MLTTASANDEELQRRNEFITAQGRMLLSSCLTMGSSSSSVISDISDPETWLSLSRGDVMTTEFIVLYARWTDWNQIRTI
jgi:hypothetical protein